MATAQSNRLISKYRSHTCDELRESDQDKSVTLSGWVARKRDHGGVVFIDLRDHYGLTQVVFPAERAQTAEHLRPETVIRVTGKVVLRGQGLVNPKLATGAIEVSAETLEILSPAEVLPFQVADDDNAPEAIRLKHRFLELRRDKLHSNIVLRSRIISALREIMQGLGFLEYQTPILTSSSPEGARDFIVPSRLHPGKFFALPQAPQQFKQLLMVAGFDRYFQIAPCFRDEDARADRTPGEFYQLDMELSFVEEADIQAVNEAMLSQLFGRFAKRACSATPFPRIRWDDAWETYGSDKPDLRNPMVLEDLTSIFSQSQFRVFANALAAGGSLRAIAFSAPASKTKAVPPRKYFDDTTSWFQQLTAGQGLAYLIIENGEVRGSISKFISAAESEALRARYAAMPGPVVLFVVAIPDAASRQTMLSALGKLRLKLGTDLGITESDAFRFCWVTDFPMFERDEHNGEIAFAHNPFSMPQGGMQALQEKKPLEIYSHQYDVVCNGYEIASGAVRNHLPEVMYKVFELAGYGPEVVDQKFGGMIRAFHFGAPPHGGIAFGIDRIVMLLSHEEAIRDVIAFPLTQTAEDLLMGAPSAVSERQLREVHIDVRLPPKVAQA
jgi:aspartyl-tRNA synthetase